MSTATTEVARKHHFSDNEIFGSYDPSVPNVWGRNLHQESSKSYFHILGPLLPRLAPVSPVHVAPCGSLVYSDGIETMRVKENPGTFVDTKGWCRQCTEFDYQARYYK